MSQHSTKDQLPSVAVLFANLKGNIGDYAILQAMIKKISESYPGHQVHVHSHPLVGIDRKRLSAFLELNPGIEIHENFPTQQIALHQRLLCSSIFKRGMQRNLIHHFASKASASLAGLADHKAVFIAGGDQWSGRELGVSMFGTLTATHQLNPNVQVFPFSLKSSIFKLYSIPLLKSFFSMLQQPIVARDSLTKGILDQVGVESQLGVDCVYGLRDDATTITPKAGRNASRILFAVKGQPKDLESTLVKLLKDGSDVEILTTCPAEDNRVMLALAEKLSLPYHQPMSWQEIVSEFKSSSMIVTNRLHGLILGSLADAPLLPVTNRKKALAFVHDAGLPHHASSVTDISHQLIEAAKTDSGEILEKVRAYRDSSHLTIHSPI